MFHGESIKIYLIIKKKELSESINQFKSAEPIELIDVDNLQSLYHGEPDITSIIGPLPSASKKSLSRKFSSMFSSDCK